MHHVALNGPWAHYGNFNDQVIEAARLEAISELFGKGNRGKGSVAVKYRDPKDSANTWTGRGRMPRWMAAATKGGRAKKEDFLV